MGERREIGLHVELDGERVASETTGVWAGPYVFVVSTVLPDRGLAFQLVSAFVGCRGVPTRVNHLTLGPVDRDPTLSVSDHAHASIDPMTGGRECAYEHVHVLAERLRDLGHEVSIQVPDDAFLELEREGD